MIAEQANDVPRVYDLYRIIILEFERCSQIKYCARTVQETTRISPVPPNLGESVDNKHIKEIPTG